MLSGVRVSNQKNRDYSTVKQLFIFFINTVYIERLIAIGVAFVGLGSWKFKRLTSQRSLVGLWGWSATLGLKKGPNFHGGQQWGILDNGRKLDPAILHERWRH